MARKTRCDQYQLSHLCGLRRACALRFTGILSRGLALTLCFIVSNHRFTCSPVSLTAHSSQPDLTPRSLTVIIPVCFMRQPLPCFCFLPVLRLALMACCQDPRHGQTEQCSPTLSFLCFQWLPRLRPEYVCFFYFLFFFSSWA